MSKRETVHVPPQEMESQRLFMQHIRDNARFGGKRFFLGTFGCQMNENDSEKLTGMLTEMGYTMVQDAKEADVILYNTCCVRENAEEKVYGHLGALKKHKKEKEGLVIGVCGCMMQQPEQVEIVRKKYPQVDLVFGTHNLHKFPELLWQVLGSGTRVLSVEEGDGVIAEGMPVTRKDGVKAWVTAMYGCNNFCTYCIVPYVRGRERSRLPEDVLSEIRGLVSQGFREITLLGQNVNSYGQDFETPVSFASLLDAVASLEGVARVRFMTSHPKDLSDELIDVIRRNPAVCTHLHLPVQSGSSQILRSMNRKYDKAGYLDLIRRIKEAIPEAALSTDIIVGFPGESDDDFEDTLDVVRQVRFDMAYTFIYSPRSGTPAAKLETQVPSDVVKQRFDTLLALQNTISKEINDGYVGKEFVVLAEGPSQYNTSVLSGRTESNKIVNFISATANAGDLVRVRIDKAQTWSLEGTELEVIR